MIESVVRIVEEYWQPLQAELLERIADTSARMGEILSAEQSRGKNPGGGASAGNSIGAFGAGSIDMDSISSLLGELHTRSTMPKKRLQRIKGIVKELAEIEESVRERPPACRFIEMEGNLEGSLGQLEEHLNAQARVARALRMAELEMKSRYRPEQHDALFKEFDWRRMDDGEMALCPPLVLFTGEGRRDGRYYGDLLRLVSSGKPVKLVAPQSGFGGNFAETGRAAALQFEPSLEFFCASLRYVFFAQGSASQNGGFADSIKKGLRSTRPCVFSVLAGSSPDGSAGEGADKNGGKNGKVDRSARALMSRAFPQMEYDPEASEDFVACLDITGNPEPAEIWPRVSLAYSNEEGVREQLEREYTFADFAAGEGDFAGEFTPPPQDVTEARLQELALYLRTSPESRKSKIPVIHKVGEGGKLVRLVPSQAVVAMTAAKMSQWQSLQELTGIRNPHVMEAEKAAVEKARSDKAEKLDGLEREMEARLQARGEEAVTSAMRNLVNRLSELKEPSDLEELLLRPAVEPVADGAAPPPPEASSPPPAEAAPAPEEEAAPPAGDTPWIESAECTTCDDCITINKRIFAYNADKKAIFKDPKGGPYKDIVKAAEKCPAMIIHPGQPADPNEKDLEKWVKRAEPFQ